jgi:3'-phosphoadenosine 5'-phosphosulfate sulfotransferase (PAPS reductase)/FAD synthetase
MKYIMNFGGGVNSTAMYFLIKDVGLPLDEIIFADTGSELPETIEDFRKGQSKLEDFEMTCDIAGSCFL